VWLAPLASSALNDTHRCRFADLIMLSKRAAEMRMRCRIPVATVRRVNPDQSVVRVTTAIAAALDRVWAVLTDLPGYRTWHPNLEILGDPDGVIHPLAAGSVLRLRTNAGTPAELEFEVTVTEVNAPSTLAWEGGDPAVFYGRHRFRLVPGGGGTVLVDQETFTGAMAAQVLTQNREAIESQYSVGDLALKEVAEASAEGEQPATGNPPQV
jgi:hypothetical protein